MVTVPNSAAGGRTPTRAGDIGAAVDRWIFVGMAVWFIAITLLGFIPDSVGKIAAVESGKRPPFPLILHVHAVLMGAFLLLLLAQSALPAAGRLDLHRRLGRVAFVLVPALVVVGFILAPAMFRELWQAVQAAPPEAQSDLQRAIARRSDITLLQLRIGLVFPLLIGVALWARGRDAGLHKRLMFLATAVALPPGIDRITWLPTTFPASPLGPDLYTLLAVAPLFAWDLVRHRRVHAAFVIWLLAMTPFTIAVHALWGSAFWRALVPRLMGV